MSPIFSLASKWSESRPSPSIIPGCYRVPWAYMSLGKAAMDMLPGLYGGPLRLPLQDATEEEKKELREALKKVGLL